VDLKTQNTRARSREI